MPCGFATTDTTLSLLAARVNRHLGRNTAIRDAETRERTASPFLVAAAPRARAWARVWVYPREMAGSSAPSPERSGEDRHEDDRADPAPAGERYGVVAVARNRKDDGRALILYTRDDSPPT